QFMPSVGGVQEARRMREVVERGVVAHRKLLERFGFGTDPNAVVAGDTRLQAPSKGDYIAPPNKLVIGELRRDKVPKLVFRPIAVPLGKTESFKLFVKSCLVKHCVLFLWG